MTAESYVQDVYPPFNRFGGKPGGQRPYSGPTHRELKSDLLLVRPVGADGWMQFRDVTEVDGKKLKDRNDRLARLFLEPSKSTAAQSRKIMEESSRYNIGDIERNINLPVLALTVLDRRMQPGFQFGLGKRDDKYDLPKSPSFVPPADAVVVSFTETQIRTMVASPQGKNLASSGHFWIESGYGADVHDRNRHRGSLAEGGHLRGLRHRRRTRPAGADRDARTLREQAERHARRRLGHLLELPRVQGQVDEDIAPIKDADKDRQDR